MFAIKLNKEDLEKLQEVCNKAQEIVRKKDKSCTYEIVQQDGEVYILETSNKARIPYHIIKNMQGRVEFVRII